MQKSQLKLVLCLVFFWYFSQLPLLSHALFALCATHNSLLWSGDESGMTVSLFLVQGPLDCEPMDYVTII